MKRLENWEEAISYLRVCLRIAAQTRNNGQMGRLSGYGRVGAQAEPALASQTLGRAIRQGLSARATSPR